MHTLANLNCLLTIRNTLLNHQKHAVLVEMACNVIIALSMNGIKRIQIFLNKIILFNFFKSKKQ